MLNFAYCFVIFISPSIKNAYKKEINKKVGNKGSCLKMSLYTLSRSMIEIIFKDIF